MAALSALQRRIAPRLRNSNWTYREVLEQHVMHADRWLDLGCGHQLLPTWMPDGDRQAQWLVSQCRLVVGVDQVQSALNKHTSISRRVAADISRLPFESQSFDLVSANMVVEHVADGHRLLAEVARVLDVGGVFLLHTVNRWFYQVLLSLCVPRSFRTKAASVIEGRAPEDVFPTYYGMNTRAALESLAASHGLIIDEVLYVNSSLAFSRVPLLSLVELGIVSLLETAALAGARSNLVVALRKR